MRTGAALSLSILLLSPVAAGPALAAWCEVPGHGLVIFNVTMATASAALDEEGTARPIPLESKIEVAPWLQFGLAEGVTAVFQPTWGSTRQNLGGDTMGGDQGISSLFFGLRREIWSAEGEVFSIQPGLTVSPGPAARDRRLGGGDPLAEIRLLYGTGFALPDFWAPVASGGFATFELAPRLREGGRHSRFDIQGTLGLDLADGDQLLIQALSQHGLGPGAGRFAKQQVTVSTITPLLPDLSLQLGAGRILAGRGVPLETSGVIALWLRF